MNSMKTMPVKSTLLDLRQHPLCERSMRLLLFLETAAAGDAFIVVNDRDPEAIFQELKPVIDKSFAYWTSDAGPEIWRVFIFCERPIRGIPENQDEMLQMAGNTPVRDSSLKEFTREVRSLWGDGNDPELPFKVKGLMEALLSRASPREPWIVKLIKEGLETRELYRDGEHGFALMGHLHQKGHHSPPHDHGSCWLLYGAYHGVAEITTYRRADEGSAASRAVLERKELNRLTSAAVIACEPGEIHSVFVTEPSVLLRFLSADLNLAKRRRDICDGVGFRIETVEPPGRDLC